MSKVKRSEFLKRVSAYPDLYAQLIRSGAVEEIYDGLNVKVVDHRTIKIDDHNYEVKPILITSNKVYIVCPYCGEIHCHNLSRSDGGDTGIPEAGCKLPSGRFSGHRTSHCDGSSGVYHINLDIA